MWDMGPLWWNLWWNLSSQHGGLEARHYSFPLCPSTAGTPALMDISRGEDPSQIPQRQAYSEYDVVYITWNIWYRIHSSQSGHIQDTLSELVHMVSEKTRNSSLVIWFMLIWSYLFDMSSNPAIGLFSLLCSYLNDLFGETKSCWGLILGVAATAGIAQLFQLGRQKAEIVHLLRSRLGCLDLWVPWKFGMGPSKPNKHPEVYHDYVATSLFFGTQSLKFMMFRMKTALLMVHDQSGRSWKHITSGFNSDTNHTWDRFEGKFSIHPDFFCDKTQNVFWRNGVNFANRQFLSLALKQFFIAVKERVFLYMSNWNQIWDEARFFCNEIGKQGLSGGS